MKGATFFFRSCAAVGMAAFLLGTTPSNIHAAPCLAPPPTFAVMAPLVIDLNQQQQVNTFKSLLDEAKGIGVQAVSVDVWWGKVQPTSQNLFDWSYYDQVFQIIKNKGLQIVPIISFHKCGGGPGDQCDIKIPDWVWNLASDMKYQSETGRIHDDAVSVWATKDPNVLGAFKKFVGAFGTQFQTWGPNFLEVNVSLGPTGELRYPSYNKVQPPAKEWEYPGRGCFQYYGARAGEDFKGWALNRFGGLSGVNGRWGLSLASDSEIRVPQDRGIDCTSDSQKQGNFVNQKNYEKTQYGRDLIDWYNESLVEHGRRLMVAAHQELAATLPAVRLGMKIPGVHWQIKNTDTPRLAEITAGLVQTSKNLSPTPQARNDAYGYKAIMDMIAEVERATGREVVLHFTAAEMDNDPDSCPAPNTSMAEALVFWISHGAADRGITHKAENALACVGDPDHPCGDDRSWQHIRNVFEFAPYGGLTFLRLSADVVDNCKPWNSRDKQLYAEFIQDFKDRRMVTVHLAEWDACFQDAGCFYNVHTWNNDKGRSAPFGLHYEGPQLKNGRACRQWWTGPVANVKNRFDFTANKTSGNATTWEGGPGQFDRVYDKNQHGCEIFVLGQKSKEVFASRPDCP